MYKISILRKLYLNIELTQSYNCVIIIIYGYWENSPEYMGEVKCKFGQIKSVAGLQMVSLKKNDKL